MLAGYMRVSSDSDRQTTDLQRDAPPAVGIDKRHLFENKASGARSDRYGCLGLWAMFVPGIAWWCASWTGLAGQCRICWKSWLVLSLERWVSVPNGVDRYDHSCPAIFGPDRRDLLSPCRL